MVRWTAGALLVPAWLAAQDGRVQRTLIVTGSGNPQVRHDGGALLLAASTLAVLNAAPVRPAHRTVAIS